MVVGLIVFIIVALIVMALLLYAVQLIPFPVTPPMPWIKPLLMVLIVLLTAVAIAYKAGVLS